jgi:hypothetical protein
MELMNNKMKSTNDNPPITQFLRYFTLVETLVLVGAGFGLFFFPNILRPVWPWEIAPFNTRFLGAIYLGALVPVGIMYLSGRWSPTRPMLRAIFTFTFIVFVVSLFHSSKFDFKTAEVWGWFVLYLSLPLSAGYHLWLYRSMPTNHLKLVPAKWGFILRSTGLLLGLYGLGLIILPNTFGSLFPWTLDLFHSQLYSATFITGCVMLFSVAKFSTRAEFIAAGLTEATFGIFSIMGLFIVDKQVQVIDWDAAITIAWLALLAVLAVLGLVMVVAGSRSNPPLLDNQNAPPMKT